MVKTIREVDYPEIYDRYKRINNHKKAMQVLQDMYLYSSTEELLYIIDLQEKKIQRRIKACTKINKNHAKEQKKLLKQQKKAGGNK